MSETLALILPFFFVFAVVYGALDVSSALRNNAVKAVISIILAFFTITNQMAIDFINQVFPYAVIIFIVVFFLGFLAKAFKSSDSGSRDYVLIIIVMGLALLLLASQGDLVELMNSVNSDLLSYVGIGLIILIFYAAYRQMAESKKKG